MAAAKKILTVDDDPKITGILKRFLTARGYEVETAGNAAEAVERAASFGPGLILLDVRLPDKSGLDVLKAVKKQHPRTAVVMLTGILEESVAEEALRLGATRYLTKPFSLDYLEKEVLEKLFKA